MLYLMVHSVAASENYFRVKLLKDFYWEKNSLLNFVPYTALISFKSKTYFEGNFIVKIVILNLNWLFPSFDCEFSIKLNLFMKILIVCRNTLFGKIVSEQIALLPAILINNNRLFLLFNLYNFNVRIVLTQSINLKAVKTEINFYLPKL